MLRAFFFLVFFVPYTLAMSILTILCILFDSSGKMSHRAARIWGMGGLKLAGVSIKVSGMEHIPQDTPVIFMGNHQSNFDILALFTAIPRRFSWMAKEELFRIPLFGSAMLRAGYIPVDRSDGRRALKSLDEAARRIRSGVSVIIFPEGTRTSDGSLLPFKKGGFILAAKSEAPIVPFAINGSMAINPRNRFELYPGEIRISFLPPVSTAQRKGPQREQLADEVRDAIALGLKELQ